MLSASLMSPSISASFFRFVSARREDFKLHATTSTTSNAVRQGNNDYIISGCFRTSTHSRSCGNLARNVRALVTVLILILAEKCIYIIHFYIHVLKWRILVATAGHKYCNFKERCAREQRSVNIFSAFAILKLVLHDNPAECGA